LRAAHVCVVGVGGVGSWAVEALARSGIGALTLVDFDDICPGNVNRQLHALDGTLGRPKVEVMAQRVRAIHPGCRVQPRQSFFLASTADEILAERFDYVLDAIDSPARKCLLIARCRKQGLPVITTGAAAGRTDPTALRVADLAFTSHDHLLQEIRKKLRMHHGFPRRKQPFGVAAVYSLEAVVCLRRKPIHGPNGEPEPRGMSPCGHGLGTAGFVTGAVGLVAAAHIVLQLAGMGGLSPKAGENA
jgi:tRNA A37 threonylcarbamoyladenosine dehydratase